MSIFSIEYIDSKFPKENFDNAIDTQVSIDYIQDAVEAEALETVNVYLGSRYTVASMTSDPFFKAHLFNIFLYILLERVQPNTIPDYVAMKKDSTLKYLKDAMNSGKTPPEWVSFEKSGRENIDSIYFFKRDETNKRNW